MKKIFGITSIITLGIFILSITISHVQAATLIPSYGWSKKIGSTGIDQAEDIGIDSLGNIYLVGGFNETVNFAADWGGTDNKTSGGLSKGFITKINSNGTYGWTKVLIAGSSVNDIALDSNGNIYVTGVFNSSGNFAADWGGTDNKTNGGNDIFITKINSDNTYGWTKKIGSGSTEQPGGIAVDANDNVFVSGSYTFTVNFAADWGGTDNKTNAGNMDAFAMKINSDGTYGWTRKVGGTSQDRALDIDVDSNGNIFFIGDFAGTVNFAADWGGSNSHSSTGFDMFVTKINSDNTYGWTDKFHGGSSDVGHSISIDSNNDIIAAGTVGENVYVVKINSNHTTAWSRSIGAGSQDFGHAVAVDSNDNIYVTGAFQSTVNFGAAFSLTDNKTSSGFEDMFVTNIKPDGSYGWTRKAGGSNIEYGYGIIIGNDDAVYVTGKFAATVNFAADFSGTDSKVSAGSNEIYVMKINQSLATAITNLVGGLLVEDIQTETTASSESTIFSSTPTRSIRLKTSGNVPVADVEVDMVTNDRNWSTVTAGSDNGAGKSFVHNLGSAEGVDSAFTLYIPKLSGTDGVRICPNAISLVEVTSGCTGEYLLSQSDVRVSVVTINSASYYRVTGVTGSGGEGENNVPNSNSLRIVLRDSEISGASTDTEVWINTPIDIVESTKIFITYELFHTGGAAITTTDITVTCDGDGFDPISGTVMSSVTVVSSEEGYLELDTNTDTCNDWVVVDINGGGGNQLTNPINPGNYSWSVAYDIDNDGAPEADGATLAYVQDENDVTITANVPPILDLELYETGSNTLLNGTGSNSCSLGVLSINTVSTCSYDIGTGTNNLSGVSVTISSDGPFNDGSGNTIDACSGTNCNGLGSAGVSAGEEEYGIYISDLGGGEYTASNSFNIQHQAIPTVDTIFAATSSTGSGTTTGSILQRLEVTHAASISTATTQGSYNQIVTFKAYTN